MRIKYSNDAENDFVEIGNYIAQDNLEVALDFIDRIQNCCSTIIANNPRIGRSRNDLAPDVYGFSFRSYLILYRISPDYIGIIRVVHAARDIKNFL